MNYRLNKLSSISVCIAAILFAFSASAAVRNLHATCSTSSPAPISENILLDIQKLTLACLPECRVVAHQAGNPTNGTTCRTSADTRFVRVDGGWKDLGENGRVWLDDVRTHVDFRGAKATCKDPSWLPEKSDFIIAEAHGFREVLSDMVQYWYWSQTEVAQSNSVYGLSVSAGNLTALPPNSEAGYIAARCVEVR